MAFESLTDKLQNVFKKLKGKGRLTEADVKVALKEVKMALLEADVNFKVVKQFVNSVTERAIGQDVMQSLTPGQMVIKIVNEEITLPYTVKKRDLEELLGISFNEEDYDTINGYLIDCLDRIPSEDEECQVEFGGYLFHVLSVDNNTIRKVLVSRTKK